MNETPAHPWSLSPEEVLRATGSGRGGLTAAAAAERLLAQGRNTLRTRTQTHWSVLLLHQFANPMVYMLLGAAAVKAYFKGPLDAAVIAAVLVFMAVIGLAQELKAQRAMAALLELSAPRAKVRRDGTVLPVDASELVRGDVLVLEAAHQL